MSTSWALMVYVTFALGGLAVLLLLPHIGRSTRTAGLILGVAGLGSAMALCASRFLGTTGGHFIFYLSAVTAVGSAVKVITHEKPVYSALYFVLTVLAIVPLLILQDAEFLAIALVIIYAGAILVTYVFVIMLAQQSTQAAYDRRSREPLIAVAAGFVTMAVIAGQAAVLPAKDVMKGEMAGGGNGEWRMANSEWAGASNPSPTLRVAKLRREGVEGAPALGTVDGTVTTDPSPTLRFAKDGTPAPGEGAPAAATGDNTSVVGGVMMTEYVVAFELAGVLLLIAMVGAIAMSRKHVPTEDTGGEMREPGAAGREAAPY